MLIDELRKLITPALIENPPIPEQLADHLKTIMKACQLDIDQANYAVVAAMCIKLALDLERQQTVVSDMFRVSLDNQIKPILKSSKDFFPLIAEEPAKPQDEKAPEPDPNDSGPGPINYNINYVRLPDPAIRERKIAAMAEEGKKRRAEEQRQYHLHLQKIYFMQLIQLVRENINIKQTKQEEILQIAARINQENLMLNTITDVSHKIAAMESLLNTIASYENKISEYRQLIYGLHSNSIGNSIYFQKHDRNFQSRRSYSDFSIEKSYLTHSLQHEKDMIEIASNPYGQTASRYIQKAADERRAARQLEERKQQAELQRKQEQEERSYCRYNVNYR